MFLMSRTCIGCFFSRDHPVYLWSSWLPTCFSSVAGFWSYWFADCHCQI